MKITVFTPFTALRPETGVIYLLANYLKDNEAECTQLCCNGVFSICACDTNWNWKRDIASCFRCISEQEKLAVWSGISCENLSRFITSEEIDETKRWGMSLDDNELIDAKFHQDNLFKYCKGLFTKRFGTENFDINNKYHPRFLKRLLVSAARTLLAAERYYQNETSDYIFIPDGSDYLTTIFTKKAEGQSIKPVTFTWQDDKKTLSVKTPKMKKPYCCELLVEDVTKMRPDPRTWTAELLDVLKEIVSKIEQ